MTTTTTTKKTMNFATLPTLGAALAGGLFAGLTTRADGTHCAVVLLPDAPPERLAWPKAMAWAAELQAELPTRPVAALLFANLCAKFDKAWHWTSESHEDDGSYAWGQDFRYGDQLDYDKSYEGRARAVRLIQLTA